MACCIIESRRSIDGLHGLKIETEMTAIMDLPFFMVRCLKSPIKDSTP